MLYAIAKQKLVELSVLGPGDSASSILVEKSERYPSFYFNKSCFLTVLPKPQSNQTQSINTKHATLTTG